MILHLTMATTGFLGTTRLRPKLAAYVGNRVFPASLCHGLDPQG
jgi:hypothetical protein